MSRILVVDDTETIAVEITTMDDPMAVDEAVDPSFIAACRACPWSSFVTDNTLHVTEADAINDAETHIDQHDRAATA
jgi:hypothetical protein